MDLPVLVEDAVETPDPSEPPPQPVKENERITAKLARNRAYARRLFTTKLRRIG
jgi:hypothetical protein